MQWPYLEGCVIMLDHRRARCLHVTSRCGMAALLFREIRHKLSTRLRASLTATTQLGAVVLKTKSSSKFHLLHYLYTSLAVGGIHPR